jgi:hypothetical protein
VNELHLCCLPSPSWTWGLIEATTTWELKEYLHPHTHKQLLYFRIKYCLTIIVPTHKCHKSPFKHSKTIYVFTSGWVIVTVQIHSRTKLVKGLKWTTAKWTINTREQQILTVQIHSRTKLVKGLKWTTAKWTINTREQQNLRYSAVRFNEKGCLPVWGWRCSKKC